ncbi:l-type lectin-domain containing receptor kinase i.3 [Quercus suber]|uniref:L-type lectin-domain containing receptor kinase i.3 n=1 Tax=Quercus suber TaxID=58331 RepID=A0AAW0LUY1_QUESU
MRLYPLLPMATILVILYVSNICTAFAQNDNQFIYNGFLQAKLHLDGSAKITSNGLLLLTNTVNISYPQREVHRKGAILDASDPRLEGNYVVEERELDLKNASR